MDELVRSLAQNEWEAQQEKKRAETAWRSAWWETTFALADMSQPTEGYDAAESELGQSRGHLAQRRRVGLAVDPTCRREAHELPPTYSLNWVREGRSRIDGKAIKEIKAAEEEHVSTREFIASVTRPEVRRTPVTPPQPDRRQPVTITPIPVPASWSESPMPTPPPRPEPERVSSDGHFSPPPRPDARPPVLPVSHGHSYNPPPPSQMALSAALMEIEAVNRAMSRLDELIPKLDDVTRPAFRAKLLELDVRMQVMVEALNPESGMTLSERDEQQLLSGG